MVAVLSRFKVANSMQDEVAEAFRQRPRAVEHAPGFLWLEVFVDHADPSIYYLLTRWTDLASFERWHGSPAHRDSHALIPKGLKLDAAWTQVLTLSRIDGTTGSSFTDAIVDATLIVSACAERSPDVHVYVLTSDATITTCNSAACRHLAGGESLAGRKLTDFMPQADAIRLRELLKRRGRSSSPARLNFAAINRVPFTLDCWLDVQATSATILGQSPFGQEQRMSDELMAMNEELAILSRERSREIRAERVGREAAEKLNRERNTFLRVLAHELRQPLGGAMAALAVLRKMNPDPALAAPRALLERQLHQITRLVEDLADIARVAGGDVELRQTRLDVLRPLRDLVTGWQADAQAQRKVFRHRLPEEPIVISGDVDRLQQVFLNLVGNALKYTPPGGAIDVSVESRSGFAVFTVRDEGEGIPADRLPRVFDLFHRETTTGSGLGVGLAVVDALVHAHGGTVSAASEGLGRGATFVVRLPLAAD